MPSLVSAAKKPKLSLKARKNSRLPTCNCPQPLLMAQKPIYLSLHPVMLIRWAQLTEQKPGWKALSNKIIRLFLWTTRGISQECDQKLNAQSAAPNLMRLNKRIIGAKLRLSRFQTWLEKHIMGQLYCSTRTANLSSKISTVLATHPRNPKLCHFCFQATSADL